MKKPFLALSLTTALSTAFLTTILPSTDLQASSVVVVPDFGLTAEAGINLTPETLTDDSLRETDQEIIALLKEHFSRDTVEFDYVKVKYLFADGKLTATPQGGKDLTDAAAQIITSLETKIRGWLQAQKIFLEAFTAYYNDRRDVTLLKLVNDRYEARGYTPFRTDDLESTLDGLYSLSMGQILTAVKKEAASQTKPITETFDPGRDVLWTALAKATVDPSTYGAENSIQKGINTLVQGAPLDQAAFEAVHHGLIFLNTDLEALISDLGGDNCALPKFKDPRYQALLGAQGVSLMTLFQQYLVNPVAVQTLFDENKTALTAEQKRYVVSNIRGTKRPRVLLAAGLIPAEMWSVEDAGAGAATAATGTTDGDENETPAAPQ